MILDDSVPWCYSHVTTKQKLFYLPSGVSAKMTLGTNSETLGHGENQAVDPFT